MKKLLYITHFSGLRVNRFWLTSIEAAHAAGYEFHLACNMCGADKDIFPQQCNTLGIIPHQIDFERNPLSSKNKIAYKQLLQLMKAEGFEIVHCNTPIGGLLGRLCAKRASVPYVIYQAHGFHFWKGAPLKNRIVYYSVEKAMAKYTDALLTINQEDFAAASRFHLKKNGRVEYIPGVGIETQTIRNTTVDRSQKRNELHIPDDAIVFLTVAELGPEKNHETAIRAFQQAGIPNSYLLICGKGRHKDALSNLIADLHCQDNVKLLGYRTDVMEIYKIADCFVFASLREGLSVALMEAMASGLPCIASKIRGNIDLLPESALLFQPTNVSQLADLMKKTVSANVRQNEINRNLTYIQNFDSSIVTKKTIEIYKYHDNYII